MALEKGSLVVNSSQGGGSKDTWVSGIAVSQAVRESTTMLSRVADSLYWMSRYLERAENTVRQLDVTMSLMLDIGGASAETHWQRLVASLGNPADLDWNGDARIDGREPHLRQAAAPLRSPPASMARAKTPARYAKKSPPSSGSGSIASITRCIRRIARPVLAPISTMCWLRSSTAYICSRA